MYQYRLKNTLENHTKTPELKLTAASLLVKIRDQILQCSSDISELCIQVSYEHILRIRVCQYAHIYEYIPTHIRIYTRVYVSLLCVPISFFM